MAQWMMRIGLVGTALAGGLAPQLSAQSLATAGSDPVTIARAGTGVAFGRSLEAIALNPALLPTLTEKQSAYVALGMEMQSQQVTAANNRVTHFTTDRNRFVPGFGAAWKLSDTTGIGLTLDRPYMRHGRLSEESGARFSGNAINFETTRLALQAGIALTPQLSMGASVEALQVDYTAENMVALGVAENPLAAPSAVNPIHGMAEIGLRTQAKKTLVGFTGGLRYAINPRMTLGATLSTGYKGTLPMTATVRPGAPVLSGIKLGDTPEVGLDAKALQLLGQATARPGQGDLTLPMTATFGFRHRFNQIWTWEVDLHAIRSGRMRTPGLAGVDVPQGTIGVPELSAQNRSGFGVSGLSEMALGRDWTVRIGASLAPASREDDSVDHMWGGSRSAGFSGGFGWKVLGGELSFGYQVRLVQDRHHPRLDASWPVGGYAPTGTSTRVESSSHLMSIGFRKSF